MLQTQIIIMRTSYIIIRAVAGGGGWEGREGKGFLNWGGGIINLLFEGGGRR